MTTDQMEKSLKGKSPIMRGSESYERTFEIQAVNQENGIESHITDIQIKKEYSPMHYDLRWSTSDNRDIPLVGNPRQNKNELICEENIDGRRVPATVKPNHRIAVVFETINGDIYHMRWDVNICTDGLLEALMCKIDAKNISQNKPIKAAYEPTSETGGSLSIKLNGSKISDRRRVYKGEPDEVYESNSDVINKVQKWINYRNQSKKGDEWVECRVINAYEDENGKEISLVVENPLGGVSSFEFNVTPDKSSPYWNVLDNIAQGDPSNLSDNENTVLLRHRSRSFYNLTVSEHINLIRKKEDIDGIDVNYEWEMKTDIKDTAESKNIVEKQLINSNIISKVLNMLSFR